MQVKATIYFFKNRLTAEQWVTMNHDSFICKLDPAVLEVTVVLAGDLLLLSALSICTDSLRLSQVILAEVVEFQSKIVLSPWTNPNMPSGVNQQDAIQLPLST